MNHGEISLNFSLKVTTAQSSNMHNMKQRSKQYLDSRTSFFIPEDFIVTETHVSTKKSVGQVNHAILPQQISLIKRRFSVKTGNRRTNSCFDQKNQF